MVLISKERSITWVECLNVRTSQPFLNDAKINQQIRQEGLGAACGYSAFTWTDLLLFWAW